ncbi:hypothetical protein GE061_017935 [Apolygus lucorum]|uniref:Armadillo repeat-containing domain-containing protein n=1 Tax=Apolygus lucorum TaxID=248454 RepID=A0A8S9XDQ4_APOLU|nr:hypothetical protein GE061_017935 [Apolygus lucorum]
MHNESSCLQVTKRWRHRHFGDIPANCTQPSGASNKKTDPQNMENASEDVRNQLKMAFNVLKGAEDAKLRFLPISSILDRMNEIAQETWEAPSNRLELGQAACDVLRSEGVIDFVLNNTNIKGIELSCAKLLKSSLLTEENREYVVNGCLKQAIALADSVSKNCDQEPQCCRAATGIVELLLDYSEKACSEIVDLGGLDIILQGCRKTDVYVLQHCSRAIANLSLYGNGGVFSVMSQKRVPMWLYPLAFYSDIEVKYYALLAATAMYSRGFLAGSERAHILDLIEKFATTQQPTDPALVEQLIRTGHRSSWLKALIPSMASVLPELRMLGSFHFCMEAKVKKCQGDASLFNEIGAIQHLKVVVSNNYPIASGFASEALQLLGENTP